MMNLFVILFSLHLILGAAASVFVLKKMDRKPDRYIWVGPGKDPFKNNY